MSRIRAKQILEFKSVGAGQNPTQGQYIAWDVSTQQFVFKNPPLDGTSGTSGSSGT
jgi:hypothetical protein